MKLNRKAKTRIIGLVAFSLAILLALPVAMADDPRPARADQDRSNVQNDAARDRAVRAVRSERAGVADRGAARDPRGSRGEVPEQDSPVIGGILVTDTDPALIIDPAVSVRSFWNGPFDGQDTLNLYVVTLLDKNQLGTEEFDLLTRFVLPDGHVYEQRVMPVDPAAYVDREIDRPDIAPHPVALRAVRPAHQLTESLPAPAGMVRVPENPTFVQTILPCSGTWITKHGLYGTWKVEVIMRKNGEAIESAVTTFDILR